MTPQHRKRILFASGVIFVLIAFATVPMIANGNVGGGLAIAGFSAIPAAVLIAVVAYVWHTNDKEAEARSGAMSSIK